MKGLWLLVAVAAAVIFSAQVSGRLSKGRKYLDPECMLDEDDKRPMKKGEQSAFIEINDNESKMKRSILEFNAPDCDFSNWTKPACTMAFSVLKYPFKVKAEVVLNLRRLSVYAALSVNENILIDAEFLLSKICLRFPSFPKLSICGHIYYFDSNFGSPLFVEACLTILVADVLELRFYCIKLENGVLSREDNIEPDEKGPFAVVFKTDRVIFEFNTAIPELLIKLLGESVQFITDAIVMVFGVVKEVVTGLITTITNFFSPRPLQLK